MKEVEITILAYDIHNSKYTNWKDCAITRALARAGLNAHEGGGEIILNSDYMQRIDTPFPLDMKVQGMYAYLAENKSQWNMDGIPIEQVEPEDFKYVIQVPETWIY